MNCPLPPEARRWRLLDTGAGSAAWNMAVDEAMLWAHTRGVVPPTLRFFTWRPPAVSVGYFQDLETEVDLGVCRARGYQVVRRPTGGRAVLHDRELTYSVVIRQAHLPGSVVESYRALSQGLLAGLRRLGVLARLSEPPETALIEPDPAATPAYWRSAACFEVPTWYELLVGEKKVVGSAQTRRWETILQHGAILIAFDPDAAAAVLRWPDPASRRRAAEAMARRACGLADALGREPDPAEVARAVAAGFEAALGVRLEPGELTEEEAGRAEYLVASKYAAAAWTRARQAR